MNVHYRKYSPTGNTTVLVTTPVPRALQPEIAAKLLDPGAVGGEQAGFIEPAGDPRAGARLQMMGGEFCGNATMSLGAMLAADAGIEDGGAVDLLIEVSGLDDPAPCRIRRQGDAWIGTVQMPLPIRVGRTALRTDGGAIDASLVELPGIAHLILPAEAAPGEAELRRRLPEWNRRIGADALGALVWRAADSSIDPLVYVPSAGTLVREHGCGSGTAAIGCALALAAGRDTKADIRQPGGTITVCARVRQGRVCALSITGRVTLEAEGDAEV